MRNLAPFALAACTAATAVSGDWPTRIVEVGCEFQMTETVGDWSSTRTLTVTEHLPFPSMRIKTEKLKSDGSTRPSMADLVGISEGKEVTPGFAEDIFCGGYCMPKAPAVLNAQRALFPLQVGKSVDVPALSKIILTVKAERSSPHVANTREFHIEATVDLGGDGSTIVPVYRVWWNTSLGFFTEREFIRNQFHEKLTSWSCTAS